MEVDEATPTPTPTASPPRSAVPAKDADSDKSDDPPGDKLYVFWDDGDKSTPTNPLHTIKSVSLTTLTLAGLRPLINQTIKSNMAFEVLYNGVMLNGDADEKTLTSLSIKPNSVVQIVPIKGVPAPVSNPGSPSRKTFTEKQLVHLSLALRTAFLSTAFARTVESLTNPETLEAIFAIAPQLRNDPSGIAIIQSAHMILQYSEPEPLKQLAAARPWVVDALNFIAATVHGEKKTVGGALPRGLMAAQLMNPAMLGDEEEEDMEEGGGTPRAQGQGQQRQQPPRNQAAPITREQLTQALSAIGGGGAGLNLGRLLRPTAGQHSLGTASNPLPTPPTLTPTMGNSGNSTSNVSPAPSSTSGNVLTGDMVARAMFEALNQLPPEMRTEQLNAFRDLARQVAAGGSGSAQDAVVPVATQESAPPQPPIQISARSTEAEALRQMREVGIQDERLSLLALRVSGGDVGTAAELILSGWQGEGADDIEGMEEGGDPMGD